MTKNKLRIIGGAVFACLCVLSFVLGMKVVPRAVCYSIEGETVTEKPDLASTVQNFDDEPEFKSLYSVPELDGYTIKSHENMIYVQHGKERLYLVKAKLSDFPSDDIAALQKGIEISDKSELVEFVEYMES